MGEAQATLGLFSAPPSINVGSPYKTENAGSSDRLKGRQFVTQPAKKGKTPDVTFQKFISNAVGDPFVEMAVAEQRDRNKKKLGQIVPVPFRPSNPSARSTGHGSYFGTFGVWPNMKTSDDYDKRPKKKGELSLQQKQIVTSPAKKGTYGMIGTNIGSNAKGVMGEYEYLAEPAKDRPRTAPNQFKPFIPASPPKKGTYGCTQTHVCGALVPHGFCGEFTYLPEGPKPSKRLEAGEKEVLKPFVPSNPPKSGKGYFGTFRWSGQEYVEDPEKIKWDKMMAERKAMREKNMGLVFRPTTGSKSLRVVSVANHPRNQPGGHPAAVNAKLFLQRQAARGS